MVTERWLQLMVFAFGAVLQALGNSASCPAEQEPLGFKDLAIALITSSPVSKARLPIISSAWSSRWDLDVIIITDEEDSCPPEAYGGMQMIKTNCGADKTGLVCKTRRGLELLLELFPGKRWYLRVMDDTLVHAPNVIHHLSRVDARGSW